MTVALVANIARPISSAISTAFSADSYGALSSYGLIGGSTNPDAVITDLFASGEQGAWYDPSDLTTMFQDSAGTTPVTADGQPVGLIRDKSGRNNHASQATAAARPLYKTSGGLHWLQFDGVDDALATGNVDLSATDKLFVAFGGLRILSGGAIVSTQSSASGFDVLMPGSNGGFRADLKDATKITDAILPDIKVVYSIAFDAAGATANDEIKVRKNSVATGEVFGAGPTSGNQSNQPLIIGNWLSALPMNGRIYSIIILGRLATTQEITDTETWVNGKTGAY